MARSLTEICNEALDLVNAESPIASVEEDSLSARVCKRHIYNVVYDHIGMHDWDFVERRVALAETTNDRTGEWSKAYALPTDFASPITLVPNYDSSSSSVPLVVTPTYWPQSAADVQEQFHERIEYRIANDILYTHIAEAILAFSVEAIEPQKWHSLFGRSVACELGRRIQRPIVGEGVKMDHVQMVAMEADRAFQEAVADDLNRNPRRQRSYVSEMAQARGLGIPNRFGVSGYGVF